MAKEIVYKVLICLLVGTYTQTVNAQDFRFNLSLTNKQMYYIDTSAYDSSKILHKKRILEYLNKKYESKNLPISFQDSSLYIISYQALQKNNTLWFTTKFEKKKDSIKVIIFRFEIQEPGEYNTPTPEKVALEELYDKYTKSKSKSSLIAYEALFSNIQNTILELKKELYALTIRE